MPSQIDILGLGGAGPANSYSSGAPEPMMNSEFSWAKSLFLVFAVIIVIYMLLALMDVLPKFWDSGDNFTLYQNADKAMNQLAAMEGAGVARNVMTEGYSSEYPTTFSVIDRQELQGMI